MPSRPALSAIQRHGISSTCCSTRAPTASSPSRPSFSNTDLAVIKNFKLNERFRLEFHAEAFNAFNHPNLFTPSYTMTDINFNNTAITISGGRQIKLWLKYSF